LLRLPAPAADTPSLSELHAALAAARPDTPGRWGRMTCSQMVRHCRRFCDLYLGRISVPWPTRLLARLAGPLFLRRTLPRSPAATPRNLRTLPALQAAAAEDPDFAAELARLLAALDAVGGLSGTYRHPLYGEMAATDVIALVRHHTAHHAHQFGLWPAPARTAADAAPAEAP
jgi:hypothetical protein